MPHGHGPYMGGGHESQYTGGDFQPEGSIGTVSGKPGNIYTVAQADPALDTDMNKGVSNYYDQINVGAKN